tara:strand:+ start:945 stop:1727 length:783 start_codon:yes stop_codon:yes gene_type:complete
MTKQKKYTFMIIPDDERDSWSFNLSKVVLQWTLFLMISIFVGSLLILVLYFPKLSYHRDIEATYNKLISERLEVLELSQDLKKIKQMDQMVRNSLGEKLDIDNPISIVDSSLSIYKYPEKSISHLKNIPSHPPINGFVSKHVSNSRNFLKDTHYGIDIVANDGDPVMAAAKGVVVFSGWNYEYGNMVILYHGDSYFTHYGHNKKNLKNQLDMVEKGEIIALVGSSGISSGPHLHFEVWREFKPVDPLLYFPEYSYTDLTF